MKYCGKKMTRTFERDISLSRPDGSSWEMRIRPLPLGFQRTLRERGIVPPGVPTRVSRDAQGRVLRDAEGMAILQRDESDADYLTAVELYHQRVAMLVIWECLREDDRYEFETVAPTTKAAWPHFADALHAELEQSGWSAGDVVWFCDQVTELSHLAGEHVQESRARFF